LVFGKNHCFFGFWLAKKPVVTLRRKTHWFFWFLVKTTGFLVFGWFFGFWLVMPPHS